MRNHLNLLKHCLSYVVAALVVAAAVIANILLQTYLHAPPTLLGEVRIIHSRGNVT